MDNSEKKIGNFLGIAEYGAALKLAVENVSVFLGAICMPAAHELGYWMRDGIRQWRLNNAIKVIDKAKGRIGFDAVEGFKLEAHPKVVLGVLGACSMEEDELLQDMWAGLIVSACTERDKQKDDGNIIFVEILKKLTSSQAKILDYICKECKKVRDSNGLFWAEHIELSADTIFQICGASDLYKVDTELDQLAVWGLLQGGGTLVDVHTTGFRGKSEKLTAQLEPSTLALNLFVKCQGYKGSPLEYFKITEIVRPSESIKILTAGPSNL